ncbi:MAG: type IX secretion system membrane protein PorP/SprF [Bacteroidales bacterium]|nr:type IX secretion system membrane protein PorP/SprF [Bacteroidales bacterium]
MKTVLKIMIALVLVCGTTMLKAQQNPMYTHYMYNTLVVNPAYAGSRDALTVTALHRSQWVGFDGGPFTQTVSLHTPLRNEHVGLGLSLANDHIGPTNTTSIFFSYAYIMQLTKKSKLSLGLSAGANIFQANLTSVQLDQQLDPAFETNVSNVITPNFGVGAYYHRERFYAGISTTNLLQNSYSLVNPDSENILIGKEQLHYFLIAGALIKISDNLDFKPTTLFKLTASAPLQADVTASFILMNRILLGAMYRSGDAVGLLAGFNITGQLHIGYSYDWSYGLKTGSYNAGSHEVMLRYDFIRNNNKQIHTPRNF